MLTLALRRWLVKCFVAALVAGFSSSLLWAEQPRPEQQFVDPVRDGMLAQLAVVEDAVFRARLQEVACSDGEDCRLRHWYAGRLQIGGRWLTLDAAQQATNDTQLAEYTVRRDAADDTPLEHERLARWCDKQELPDLARMHWMHVLRFVPNDKRALAALGLEWFDGRLLTAAERQAYQQQLAEYLEQTKSWRKNLRRIRRDLQHGEPAEKLAAQAELAAVRDPAAVPVLLEEFVGKNAKPAEAAQLHALATAALANIKSPAATEALADLVVNSPWEEVRYTALQGLKSRPHADYVPALVGELAMPMELAVSHTEIESTIVSNYSYSQDGPGNQYSESDYSSYRYVPANKYVAADFYRSRFVPRQKIRDAYTMACGGHTMHVPAAYSREHWTREYADTKYGENPFYGAARARTLAVSQNEAASELAALEQDNQQLAKHNEQVATVLNELTDQQLPPNPKSWWQWWGEHLAQHPDQGTAGTRQQLNMALLNQEPRGLSRGTWVWTNHGRQPIEAVRHGDFVLAQHPRTGELAYRVVLAISHPRDLAVTKVDLGEDAIHCAPGHVAWAAGLGWRQATKLSLQSKLHGLASEESITGKAEAFTIDCYDLVVDDFHTFFIGEKGILVHDASPIEPAPQALPGFSPAAFAEAVASLLAAAN